MAKKLITLKLWTILFTNITLEPYFTAYWNDKTAGRPHNQCLSILPLEIVFTTDYIPTEETVEMIVVWINYETLFSNTWNDFYSGKKSETKILEEALDYCSSIRHNIQKRYPVPIIWLLFEDYESCCSGFAEGILPPNNLVDKINIKLLEQKTESMFFMNMKQLIARLGLNKAFDRKGKYRWNTPYSKELMKLAVNEIDRQYQIITGRVKKCLILDCDNVLWGGILSEDGISQIRLGPEGLGRKYLDFQRFILSLYYHGVMIAICSKNDLEDVMEVFQTHSSMLLKKEQVSCFMVNWNDKPSNIVKIAEILGIDLTAMVFVDDSPSEVEAVKSLIPEVTTLLFDGTIYENLGCLPFSNSSNPIEVDTRTKTYRTNQLRFNLQSQFDNNKDYLKALEMEVKIQKAMVTEYARMSELTLRANRCTNGKRVSISEIKTLAEREGVMLYSVAVKDRFSDLGLVGVLGVEDEQLRLFCLSCRALGRELEEVMVSFIKSRHQVKGFDFYPTGKNNEIREFLENRIKH